MKALKVNREDKITFGKYKGKTFGEDAVIEFVSSMPEENFKDLTKFKLEEYER
jgi:hypothetical protein